MTFEEAIEIIEEECGVEEGNGFFTNEMDLKLEYNSENLPLKITFFCLNALVVQVLIAPVYNRK